MVPRGGGDNDWLPSRRGSSIVDRQDDWLPARMSSSSSAPEPRTRLGCPHVLLVLVHDEQASEGASSQEHTAATVADSEEAGGSLPKQALVHAEQGQLLADAKSKHIQLVHPGIDRAVLLRLRAQVIVQVKPPVAAAFLEM